MSGGDSHRVAFFGGSFDPPHRGHLAVARAARAALQLDKVLFAPVGAQPLKPGGPAAGFEDRIAMTRLAVSGEPGFEVSTADAPTASGAPNYSYDTMLGLRARIPAGGVLFCLLGADSFLTLRRWRNAARIPLIAPLIVASRPGQPLSDLRPALPQGLHFQTDTWTESVVNGVALCAWTLADEAGNTAPFYVLPGLQEEVSASEIRERALADEDKSGMVPSPVAEYLRAHRLYR